MSRHEMERKLAIPWFRERAALKEDGLGSYLVADEDS
jgi:hypothetical protein